MTDRTRITKLTDQASDAAVDTWFELLDVVRRTSGLEHSLPRERWLDLLRYLNAHERASTVSGWLFENERDLPTDGELSPDEVHEVAHFAELDTQSFLVDKLCELLADDELNDEATASLRQSMTSMCAALERWYDADKLAHDRVEVLHEHGWLGKQESA